MTESAKYLRFAQDCLDFAERMDGDAKQQLIEMSDVWLELAEKALSRVQSRSDNE
jgi:hypothetical protein